MASGIKSQAFKRKSDFHEEAIEERKRGTG
jgi:hypothetical protein